MKWWQRCEPSKNGTTPLASLSSSKPKAPGWKTLFCWSALSSPTCLWSGIISRWVKTASSCRSTEASSMSLPHWGKSVIWCQMTTLQICSSQCNYWNGWMVAPHVELWQHVWKKEGCIGRQRSREDSRQEQPSEGPAQVLMFRDLFACCVCWQPQSALSLVAVGPSTSDCPTPPVVLRRPLSSRPTWRGLIVS